MEHPYQKFNQDQQQLIAFRIAQQDYCFDIKRVKEIRGWTPTTPIPCSPAVVLGMINLRGAVIPVLDLAARMGFGSTNPCSRHAVLVVEIGDQIVGLLVDGVSEILTANKNDIQPAPVSAASGPDQLVSGVISQGDRIITLLALDIAVELKGFAGNLDLLLERVSSAPEQECAA